MAIMHHNVEDGMAAIQVQELYHQHRGWLHQWLRSKLGCSEQAADLAQDTFVRVMTTQRGLHTLEQPRAYLTSIAKNLVIDHWRRKELEQAYLAAVSTLPEQEAPSPEQTLLLLQAVRAIDRVLQTLPAQTREIFLLSQLDGLTYAAIAVQLRCALPTVKRHMRKAFMTVMQTEQA